MNSLGIGRQAIQTLLVISFLSSPTWAAELVKPVTSDPNLIHLGKEIAIRLPELPSDIGLRLVFESLTPTEQRSFYYKRRFIIEKLAGGLAQPGVRSGIRWVKDRIHRLKGHPARPLEMEARPLEMEWENLPVNLAPETRAHVEASITALVDNMWVNSTDIAKANGLGFTFVGGLIWNTSALKTGYVWGRSLSVDIGVDFKTQTGYVRYMRDAQAMKTPGLSADIGLMTDFLIHVTNPDLIGGESLEATHVKLPMIGCFRYGEDYKAWGVQMGLHVVEAAGMWLAAMGDLALGTSLIGATRTVGMATIYSTTLERRTLKVQRLSAAKMRRLGFGKLFDLVSECDQLLQ